MGFRKTALSLLALASLLSGVALAATIAPGQVRTVTGNVTAVDIAHRAVVIDVPGRQWDLTVGVTLKEGVEPMRDGRPIPLSSVSVGDSVVLRYTRQGGELIGLQLKMNR